MALQTIYFLLTAIIFANAKIFLHLGPVKTASSTLQTYMFYQRDLLTRELKIQPLLAQDSLFCMEEEFEAKQSPFYCRRDVRRQYRQLLPRQPRKITDEDVTLLRRIDTGFVFNRIREQHGQMPATKLIDALQNCGGNETVLASHELYRASTLLVGYVPRTNCDLTVLLVYREASSRWLSFRAHLMEHGPMAVGLDWLEALDPQTQVIHQKSFQDFYENMCKRIWQMIPSAHIVLLSLYGSRDRGLLHSIFCDIIRTVDRDQCDRLVEEPHGMNLRRQSMTALQLEALWRKLVVMNNLTDSCQSMPFGTNYRSWGMMKRVVARRSRFYESLIERKLVTTKTTSLAPKLSKTPKEVLQSLRSLRSPSGEKITFVGFSSEDDDELMTYERVVESEELIRELSQFMKIECAANQHDAEWLADEHDDAVKI